MVSTLAEPQGCPPRLQVVASWVVVHPDPASLRKLWQARWNVHSKSALTWPATTSANSQGPDGQPPSWPPPEGEGDTPAAQRESAPSVTCGDLDAHPPQFRQASHTPSNGHRLRLGRRLPQQ